MLQVFFGVSLLMFPTISHADGNSFVPFPAPIFFSAQVMAKSTTPPFLGSTDRSPLVIGTALDERDELGVGVNDLFRDGYRHQHGLVLPFGEFKIGRAHV